MNYLCMAVQKEAVRKERFESREEAWAYFWEQFGGEVTEQLEAEKAKLEGRIRYYDRRAKKQEEDPKEGETYRQRREAVREELEQIGQKLCREEERYQICRLEERYDLHDLPVFGEPVPILHLAGVSDTDGGFWVIEESYECTGWKDFSEAGILEVRKRMPEAVTANSISLEICQESPEAAEKFRKKIRRMVTEARRNFRTVGHP